MYNANQFLRGEVSISRIWDRKATYLYSQPVELVWPQSAVQGMVNQTHYRLYMTRPTFPVMISIYAC